jgi:5'-deoxynucleotidase YfbR-like HD superfamily hydrolase
MTVARWHQNESPRLRNSGDCIERHQWRVALLVQRICAAMREPMRVNLLQAALYHDEAERVLGDMPGPVKAGFPALARAYADAEAEVLSDMDLPGYPWELTEREEAIKTLADRADAWRWAIMHGEYCGDWRDAESECHGLAWGIGPRAGAWWAEFAKEVQG